MVLMVNTTRPGRFTPGRVGTHLTGGWVDSRAGMDGFGKLHSVIRSTGNVQKTLGDMCAVFPSYQLAHLTPRPQQANNLVTTALLTTWRFKHSIILRSSLLQLTAHMLWVRISIWPMSFSRQSALPGVYSVIRQRQCGITSSFKFQYLQYVEIKCQLDATEVFIADLIACSTCFGHHYAHHHELKTLYSGCCSILQTGHITFSSTPDQQLENHSTKYHRQQTLYNTLELLTMGIVVPETCWASNKICNKNLCCI